MEEALASSTAAYATLETALDGVQQELADAQASIGAWEDFLANLDNSMSRLEKFLVDSYNYTPYDRSTLSIPTNMLERNPDFLNQDPTNSNSSVYVGDGAAYTSQAYTNSGLSQFAGNKKKENKVSGFLSMMGRARHIKQGFLNFAGQEPFSRTDGDNGDTTNGEEKTFELTKTAKTFLYLTGGAIAAFGIYKALKKK